MPATGSQGETIEFWADSSFGDSSKHYTAKVRVVPWGDFVAPDGKTNDPYLWYVDVISTQWQGAPSASCSQIWESFPDLGGPPAWLTTPARLEDLLTNQPLYYLAGSLIQSGQVDAQDCPGGGLLSAGVANTCGLERAQPAVTEWQNQFDVQMINVGQNTGIPAQLMKNIFSRESQFWPGIFKTYKEAGLGQLTENGADTVLLWNPSFFNQFCPLVFEKTVCGQGFFQLSDSQRSLIRGALVNKVNASCPDCPSGIDLTQAAFSVNVFASSLLANCEQTGQVIFNNTGKNAGLVSSYVDLWRFTLVNYNAGSGCLEEAVKQSIQEGKPITWDNVSARLDEACHGAVSYVDDISAMGVQPTSTPTNSLFGINTPLPPVQATLSPINPTTPAPTPSLTSTQSSLATPTPTSTQTPSGYPAPNPTSNGPTATIEGYP
jgi:hypothetical protein